MILTSVTWLMAQFTVYTCLPTRVEPEYFISKIYVFSRHKTNHSRITNIFKWESRVTVNVEFTNHTINFVNFTNHARILARITRHALPLGHPVSSACGYCFGVEETRRK